MSFESIDQSIQRDMAGIHADASKLLGSLPATTTQFAGGMSKGIYELASASHEATSRLISDLGNAMMPPAVVESVLSDDQWNKLQVGYNVLDELEQQPELVLAPEGRQLWFWKGFYSKLRQFQNETMPDHPDKLSAQTVRGKVEDGLDISASLVSYWNGAVSGNNPRWSLTVMPGVSGTCFNGANYEGYNRDGLPDEKIKKLKTDHPEFLVGKEGSSYMEHPSVETYLMAQALRLHNKDGRALDEDTFSWLESTLPVQVGDDHFKNFRGDWVKILGCVRIVASDTDTHTPFTRPAIREVLS